MKKNIDCIAMKRRGSLQIHRRLKGMNLKEQVEYWAGRNAVFHQEQEMLGVGKPGRRRRRTQKLSRRAGIEPRS
jgi:hypothetical protein